MRLPVTCKPNALKGLQHLINAAPFLYAAAFDVDEAHRARHVSTDGENLGRVRPSNDVIDELPDDLKFRAQQQQEI